MCSPMTELNSEGAEGIGGGEGETFPDHGSNPSSYTEPPSGLSSTKLFPSPEFEVDWYLWAGRGALNMSRSCQRDSPHTDNSIGRVW